MGLHADERENLEPGMGFISAPAPETSGAEEVPFANYGSYWGFDEQEIWHFPDGKQWIKFQKMDEGRRGKYLKATRGDLVINQRSGDAKIPLDQANDRRELILASVVDWHIVRRAPRGGFELVPFTQGQGGTLGQWIQSANPAIVADLEKAIRRANPWLLNEMSVDQIDKEILDLQELRKDAAEREEREKRFQSAG